MLSSIALIILFGLFASMLSKKIKLPHIIGMLLVGIIIGPSCLNLLDNTILEIAGDLKEIALIIILLKAGLSLDLNELKKVGRPAVLLCFIPATFEIIGFIIFGPMLLGLSLIESAILGAIMGAVSPAVIVPRMTKLIEDGHGKKGLPQMVIAGSSADDVFVIVLFTAFLGMANGGEFSITSFINVPISILLGASMGYVVGFLLVKYFKHFHIRDTYKVMMLIAFSFLFITVEELLEHIVPISGLLAVMSMGIAIYHSYSELANRVQHKFSIMWLVAEIVLFVLVGSSVKIASVKTAGLMAIVILFVGLAFRMLGTIISLLGTKFNAKERFFVCLTQLPKATVQAAIGGVPLQMGLACGNTVLTVAVLSILITAPMGSILIDYFQKKMFVK